MNDGLMFYHVKGRGDVTGLASAFDSFRTDGMGIYLCRRGQAFLVVNDVPCEVCPRQLGVVFPQSTVRVGFRSEDLDAIVVRADFGAIQSVLNRVSDMQSVMRVRECPTCILGEEDFDTIQQYVQLLFRMKEVHRTWLQRGDTRKAQLYEQQCEHLREATALHVIAVVSTAGTPKKGLCHKDEVVSKFMSNLHTHFRRHHNVGYYAALQCMSPRYFSAIVREHTTRTPSQWIAAFLEEESKYLLGATARSVKQVAEELNFPNPSYFGKWFKERVGISPAGWKRGVRSSS